MFVIEKSPVSLKRRAPSSSANDDVQFSSMRPVVKAARIQLRPHRFDKFNVQRVTLDAQSPCPSLDPTTQLAIKAASSTLLRIETSSSSINNDCGDVKLILFGNLQRCVVHVRNFVRQLPGYEMLAMPERCALFAAAVIPIFISQLCFSKSSPFFGMSQMARAKFLQQYPCFETIANDLTQIAEAIASWNPSTVEQALFQASLFFQQPSRLVTQRKICNIELLNHLHNCYKASVQDLFSNTLKDHFDLKLRHFARVSDLMHVFVQDYTEVARWLCSICCCHLPISLWSSSKNYDENYAIDVEEDGQKVLPSINKDVNVNALVKLFHEIHCVV